MSASDGNEITSIAWSALPGGNKVKQLTQLALPAIASLVTVAQDPEKWVRNNLVDVIQEIVAKWLVGGILDALQWVLGYVLMAYGIVVETILGVIPQLRAPYQIIEDAAVGGIETIYAAARGIALSVGLAGPPAAAFAVALTSAVLAATVYALVKVIPGSDLVEGAASRFDDSLEVFR